MTAVAPRTAGAPARRKPRAMARAPQDTPAGFWTYLFLAVTLMFTAFPLYWMFVIATSNDEALAKLPPAIIPGDGFMTNVEEVFSLQDVYFAASLVNSVIVSTVVTPRVEGQIAAAHYSSAVKWPAARSLKNERAQASRSRPASWAPS